PKQVMNMEPALGDQVAERTVGKQVVMNDRGDEAQRGERHEERRERSQGDAATEIERSKMMAQSHGDSGPSCLSRTAPVERAVAGCLSWRPMVADYWDRDCRVARISLIALLAVSRCSGASTCTICRKASRISCRSVTTSPADRAVFTASLWAVMICAIVVC